MRILVKVGGAQLERTETRATFARAVARTLDAGHEVVVVHGGGRQIQALARQLGLKEQRVRGLRVTDDATAEVVQWVLAGQVGKELAAALTAAGAPAVSLCGADAGLFDAEPLDPELGRVGKVGQVRSAVVHALLEASLTPLIASVAPRTSAADVPTDRFYNINADHAVPALAGALEADAVLFLTDVDGVLDRGCTVTTLDRDGLAELERRQVVSAGMIPKLEAALEAANADPGTLVKVASAAGEEALLAALAEGSGTRVHAGAVRNPEDSIHG